MEKLHFSIRRLEHSLVNVTHLYGASQKIKREKEITTMKININSSKKLIGLPVLMGALALAGASQTAKAATTNAELNIQNFTTITATNTVSMTPDITDIQDHFMDKSAGIHLGVTTNNDLGCNVTVSAGAGDVSTGKIAADDIQLRSADAGTDEAFDDYNSLSESPVLLWNTDQPSVDATDVPVDVRFKDLHQYPAASGATKQYTNVITFTVAANS